MNTKQMKITPFLLLVLFIFLTNMSTLAAKQEYTKQKEINKSFKVSRNDLLQVDNRFGNITVTHWNRQEVSIRVEIETKSSREAQAQRMLDDIKVEIRKTGNTVSAVTSLAGNNKINNNNDRMTINYFISMPSELTSDLSQKYGNINLPQQNDGKCTLHVKYGNLNAGSFTADLSLEAKYGNVDIANLKTASFDLGYVGSLVCKDADKLSIDGKYSNLELGAVRRLDLDKKYGNIRIKKLDEGNMDVKYSEVTIDYLKDDLTADGLSYSTLSIKELSPRFTRLEVNARYGNLKLRIPESASFKVIAENMKYGDYDIKGFKTTDFSKEDHNFRSEINGGGNRRIYFDGNNYSNLTIRTL